MGPTECPKRLSLTTNYRLRNIPEERRFQYIIFLGGCSSPHWVRGSSFTRSLYHTQRRTTVSRTTLDGWSAHRIDLYLTTHNTHNRNTSILPVGFEPTVSVGEQPQTNAKYKIPPDIKFWLSDCPFTGTSTDTRPTVSRTKLHYYYINNFFHKLIIYLYKLVLT